MAKKVEKTKEAKTAERKAKKEKDSLKLPKVGGAADDDVDESHPVADLSAVPTPVITFEMPSVNAKEDVGAKSGKKPQKSADESPSLDGSEILTAEGLNNEIVKMRSVVQTAKAQLVRSLVRKKKTFEAKSSKSKDAKESFGRKSERLGEEIENIKIVDKDTVTKFALLNKKSLDELKIEGETPVLERLLYKIACTEHVVNAVGALRKKYGQWDSSTAFFLQRLGLQYSGLKDKQKKANGDGEAKTTHEGKMKKDTEKEKMNISQGSSSVSKLAADLNDTGINEDEDDDNEDDDDIHKSNGVTDDDEDGGGDGDGADEKGDDEDDMDDDKLISDLEICDSDEEAEKFAAEKRRNLFLELIGSKVDEKRRKQQKTVKKDSHPKATAAPRKSKQSKETLQHVLQKTLAGVEAKKPTRVPVQVKKGLDENKPTSQETQQPAISQSSETLVRRVKLSDGGIIAKEAKDVKEPSLSRKEKEEEICEEDEDEEGDPFFVSKTGKRRADSHVALGSAEVGDEMIPKRSKRIAVNESSQLGSSGTGKKLKASSKSKPSDEIHPSWTAQMNKRKMQAAKPSGKKIVFDDDD